MLQTETKNLDISHPGRSKQLISPSEAVSRKPDFFTGRPEDVNWTLRIRHLDGRIEELPVGTDWEAISRFGSVRSAVVTKPDGTPDFDRPRYDEAPNINAIVWGRDKKTGEIKIGIISQARPHADNVFEQTDKPMVFESIPMGFMSKIVGKDQVERLEHPEEAAAREASQEAGASIVKDITYPEYPSHYPNPTFVGTTSDVVFVEVDLDKVDKMKIDRDELIYKADYIPLSQVLKDIKAGKTDMGIARMATSNSVILMFLSTLNTYQNAERNQSLLSIEGEANRAFKKDDPAGYLMQRLRISKIKHPDRYADNEKRAKVYLAKNAQENKQNEIKSVSEPQTQSGKSIFDRARRFLLRR